ncbi:uncharacterized protein LOC144127503 [Amblyomma americanum]
MKATTETGLTEPGTTVSTIPKKPVKGTQSPSKSESEEEDDGVGRRLRVGYYRKLMLPGGEVVDITKRNQFIREWKEKRLKCDPRPYYMLGAATALLLLMLYIYAYHQAFIYNLFGRPGENVSPQKLQVTPFDTTSDDGVGGQPYEDAQ